MLAKYLGYSALLASLFLGPRVCLAALPCEELGMEAVATNRCKSLQSEFEIDKALISACKNFGKKDEEKLNCVRSGASLESLHFCLRMHFKSSENALSCLHYTNDLDVAESCGRLYNKENEIIDCLKSGRDVSSLHNEEHFPQRNIATETSGKK